MEQDQRTVFYQSHVDAGAKMVDFAGWRMPIQYSEGIVTEHLLTRKEAGLFDVSHMGEFEVTGPAALDLVQKVTINDAAALETGQVQYSAMCYPDGASWMISCARTVLIAPSDTHRTPTPIAMIRLFICCLLLLPVGWLELWRSDGRARTTWHMRLSIRFSSERHRPTHRCPSCRSS